MELDWRTIRDIDVRGKRVLVRVDLNVPMSPDGAVADDLRIRASLPTIEYLLVHGGSLVLMSHLGRPKGKVIPGLTLRPVAAVLTELLGREVRMAPDCVGKEVKRLVDGLQPGEILLLENLRFHKAETANDSEFARQLAALGDIYVNDAFGTAHRAHASTVGIPEALGSGIAGFLMDKELRFFQRLLAAPDPPFLAILGGAKVSGKIKVLKNLLEIADTVFVGGAMANTFFLAQGFTIGDSLVEPDAVETANTILCEAARLRKNLMLPVDLVVARDLSHESEPLTVPSQRIPEGYKALDIGPESLSLLASACADAKTVFWNGPMGVFESPPFDRGTLEVGRRLAEATKQGAITVVGGGDSAAALRKAGLADSISHLSTGGGASLELVEGRELPGIMALQRRTG